MNKLLAPLLKLNNVMILIKFAISSSRSWWFMATTKSYARFYKTVLGSFWLGLSNLLSVAVLAAVYGTVFKIDDYKSYVVYLGFGLLFWNTLSSAIISAPNLFEVNSNKLHNLNLHPIFYTLEEWAFQIQTFLQSFALVFTALVFINPSLILNFLSFGFLPIINLLLFIYWFPVLVCLAGAYFRDLYQLVPVVLQVLFLLSPILYQKESLGSFKWAADINVLFQFIAPAREALINGVVFWPLFFVLLGFNLLGIIASIILLDSKKTELPFLF